MAAIENILEVYVSNRDDYSLINRLLEKGIIKKIAPEIYTSKKDEDPGQVIRRNLFRIIGLKFPGCVISHRSAFDLKPYEDNIFITSTYNDKIQLPGLTVNIFKGHGPLEGDGLLFGARFSNTERAYLENLQIAKGKPSKCLSREQLEEKLEMILQSHGEVFLNKLRDRARLLSDELQMKNEFEKLNKIIGALLNTGESKILKSDIAIARANKKPYDQNRIVLFEKLFNYLSSRYFKPLEENNNDSVSFNNFSFFESYFSNYIEGTKFSVEDARSVIETGVPIPARSEDSHDILGTYKITNDRYGMSVTPKTPDHLINLLKTRHKIMMEYRTGVYPGVFKEKSNQAGNTVFVLPEYVEGTLREGFELYDILREPFSKAAFIKFMLSEVHPFNDGNGRMARIFMNSELVASSQCKIIITTRYRDDYITALKGLTRQHDPVVYVKMLQAAHTFSNSLQCGDYNNLLDQFNKAGAFEESKNIDFSVNIDSEKNKKGLNL